MVCNIDDLTIIVCHKWSKIGFRSKKMGNNNTYWF